MCWCSTKSSVTINKSSQILLRGTAMLQMYHLDHVIDLGVWPPVFISGIWWDFFIPVHYWKDMKTCHGRHAAGCWGSFLTRTGELSRRHSQMLECMEENTFTCKTPLDEIPPGPRPHPGGHRLGCTSTGLPSWFYRLLPAHECDGMAWSQRAVWSRDPHRGYTRISPWACSVEQWG